MEESQRDKLIEQKKRFAQQFFEAVVVQSVEKCTQLILPFDEYQKLTGDTEMKPEKYAEGLVIQCESFFKKHKKFFNQQGERLLEESVADSKIYKLGDEHEISDNVFFRAMDSLWIRSESIEIEEGVFSSLSFDIEKPVMFNSEIRINNFLMVKARESIDESQKRFKSFECLGFHKLPKHDYLEIMKNQSFYSAKYYSDDQWFIHEGDLHISPDQVEVFSGYSFMVTGNLIIDGVLDYQEISSLFVLGDVKAKSILLSSSTCYVAGTTYFDEALIVMGGSGAAIQLNDTNGPFIYNDSDAADINASSETVKAYVDYSGDNSFGDLENLIPKELWEYEDEDEDETSFDIGGIYQAIIDNEKFLKN